MINNKIVEQSQENTVGLGLRTQYQHVWVMEDKGHTEKTTSSESDYYSTGEPVKKKWNTEDIFGKILRSPIEKERRQVKHVTADDKINTRPCKGNKEGKSWV